MTDDRELLPEDEVPRPPRPERGEERGDPPPDHEDPKPRERIGLPDPDPNWQPSKSSEKLDAQYGEHIRERRGRLLWPHLVIRAMPGDTGDRPLWPPVPCWTSPDIWIFPEDSHVDLSHGVVSPTAGKRYRLGVHVWNLGRFPAYGILVRAWWVLPGFSPNATDPKYRPHYIGGTFTNLGDRDSTQSHQIVLLPDVWVPSDIADGHQCLFACAESFADPRANDVFAANDDRHVAQRNISVISGANDASPLLDFLGEMLGDGTFMRIAVGTARTPDLAGAVARGVSSSNDVPVGVGPLHFEEPRPIGDLVRRDGRWFTDRGDPGRTKEERRREGPRPPLRSLDAQGLGAAMQRFLRADGTSASELLNGAVLGGVNGIALHLSTEKAGYTVVLHW